MSADRSQPGKGGRQWKKATAHTNCPGVATTSLAAVMKSQTGSLEAAEGAG